jgi:hypothetical protein
MKGILTTRNTSIFPMPTVVCKPASRRAFRYIRLVSITMQIIQHYWPITLSKGGTTISLDMPKIIFIATMILSVFIYCIMLDCTMYASTKCFK